MRPPDFLREEGDRWSGSGGIGRYVAALAARKALCKETSAGGNLEKTSAVSLGFELTWHRDGPCARFPVTRSGCHQCSDHYSVGV